MAHEQRPFASRGHDLANMASQFGPAHPLVIRNVDNSGNSRGHYGHVINYNLGGNPAASDEQRAQAILHALSYLEMGARFRNVHEPGEDEYKWAFKWKVPLRAWLTDEEGIFWVSGKAGSGKSTFMKFLCCHPTTQALLAEWSAGKHLVVASHFFWCATTSSELEKTREGMLRTILFDAISSLPDAVRIESVRTIFPTKWKTATLLSTADKPAWTESELLKALGRLIALPNTCFAFFVDGLDEYSPAKDHGAFIRQLQQLAKDTNAKLCVSSRPWRVFETRFGGLRSKLNLNDLTQVDMCRHIVECLREAEQDAGVHSDFDQERNDGQHCKDYDDRGWSPVLSRPDASWTRYLVNYDDPRWADLPDKMDDWVEMNGLLSRCSEQASSLINLIAEKSEGVFLWVHLLVQDLQKQLRRGQAVQRLREYVDLASPELHDYFKTHILQRISGTELSDVCRVLKILSALAQAFDKCPHEGFFSILNLWHLQRSENNLRDPDFALRAQWETVSWSDLELFEKETQAYISATVGDFVTVEGIRIRFLHRSVLDYLLDEQVQLWMHEHVPPHFCDFDLVARLTLARLRCRPPIDSAFFDGGSYVDGRRPSRRGWRYACAALRAIHSIYRLPRKMMFQGESTFTLHDFPTLSRGLVQSFEVIMIDCLDSLCEPPKVLASDLPLGEEVDYHEAVELFLHYGLVEFAHHLLLRSPGIYLYGRGALVFSLIVRSLFAAFDNGVDLPYLLDCIFAWGADCPNGPWHTFLWLWGQRNHDNPSSGEQDKLWSIARAFIEGGADLSTPLCALHAPKEIPVDEIWGQGPLGMVQAAAFSNEGVCSGNRAGCRSCPPESMIMDMLDKQQAAEFERLLRRRSSRCPTQRKLAREERAWAAVLAFRQLRTDVRMGSRSRLEMEDIEHRMVLMRVFSDEFVEPRGLLGPLKVHGSGFATTYRNVFEFCDISIEPRTRDCERGPRPTDDSE